MAQPDPPKKPPSLWLLLSFFGTLGLFGLICCAGAIYFGFQSLDGIEADYYEDCQDIGDSHQCSECCEKYNHNGHVHGELLNDDDKVCGCI